MTIESEEGWAVKKLENLPQNTRRRFWRQVKDNNGQLVWIQTTPLPADSVHMAQYLAKGFMLEPPPPEPVVPPEADTPTPVKKRGRSHNSSKEVDF